MNPRRVGVVATSFVAGGAEQYLVDLYGGGGPAPWSGTLIGSIPSWEEIGLPQQELHVGPKWSRSRIRQEPHRIVAEAIMLARRAGELGRGQEFTVFHCQYKREQIGMTSALSRHKPVVWTEHGRFYRGPRAVLLRVAYRTASRSVGVIVCVGQEVAEDVAAVCGRSGPEVLVIPNGVDTERFRPAATPWERSSERSRLDPSGLLGDLPLVMVTSRLDPNKRLERVLEATKAAGLGLVIAGSGPDEGRLRRLSLGQPVIFTGHLRRSEVSAALRASDLFVFSASDSEGGSPPLSVLEAMASGLGTVAFEGDIGSSAVAAAGGLVLGAPLDLKDAWRAVVSTDARARARAYAEQRGLVPWRAQYARVFARIADGPV